LLFSTPICALSVLISFTSESTRLFASSRCCVSEVERFFAANASVWPDCTTADRMADWPGSFETSRHALKKPVMADARPLSLGSLYAVCTSCSESDFTW
jgi:hypothetical protein